MEDGKAQKGSAGWLRDTKHVNTKYTNDLSDANVLA